MTITTHRETHTQTHTQTKTQIHTQVERDRDIRCQLVAGTGQGRESGVEQGGEEMRGKKM
jgi:hypothetical protein